MSATKSGRRIAQLRLWSAHDQDSVLELLANFPKQSAAFTSWNDNNIWRKRHLLLFTSRCVKLPSFFGPFYSPVLPSMSKVYGVGFPPVASNYCCSQPSQRSMYSMRALIQYIISLLSQERDLLYRSAQYTVCPQGFKNPHEVVCVSFAKHSKAVFILTLDPSSFTSQSLRWVPLKY